MKNFHHCIDHYNGLAEYFGVLDLKSAKYFYRRCIDVAQEVGAQDTLAKAHLNLGMYLHIF